MKRRQRTKTTVGRCQDCGWVVSVRYEIVVPDGPEDGMTLWVCHQCNTAGDLDKKCTG